MASRRFNYNIGFIGIQFPGTSAGSVSITAQNSGGSYNFNLPTSSGSTGQVLLSGGGGTSPMTWGSSQLNLSSRFLNSAFSLPSGTATIIPFEGIDATNSLGVTGLSYNAGTFTNTLDTPIQLMLTVCANFIGSNSGYRRLYILDNTGQIYGNVEQLANLNNDETGLSTSAQFVVGVGESFGVYVFQNSGSSMTLESGTSGNTKIQMTSMMSIPTGGTINAILTSNTLGALITTTSGNVGIGVINPQEKLNIKGAILLENEAVLGDNPHTYINFAETGFSDRFAIGCDFSGIGTANNLFITSNSNGNLPLISDSKLTMTMIGNVGISNTAPAYTLDIAGSLRATNTALLTNNSNTIGNIFTTGGNVGIGATAPSSRLTISGLAAQIALHPLTNGSEGSIAFYNNTLASGDTTRWVAGNNAASGVGNFGFWNSSLGRAALMMTSTGNVGIGITNPNYTLDINGTFETSNTNGLLLFASSGNIGIGTTAPSTPLHIHNTSGSNIMFSRYTTNTSGGNLNFGEIIWKSFHRSNNNAIIRCTSQSGPSLLGWDDAGRLEFLTQVGAQTPSIRMVIAENGNVGIGITSPNAQLSINNDFHIAANSSAWNSTVGKGIFMRYSTNAGQDSGYIQSIDRISNVWTPLSIQAQSLTFTTNGGDGSERITITSTGNVGIGTTAPTVSLDVVGTVSSNNGIRFGGTNFLWNYTNYVSIDTQPSTPRFVIHKTTGNVGIGTTSPNSRLYITDTSTSPFALIIDGTGKTVNNGININAATGYVPFINFQVNGNGPNIAATSTQLQITQTASHTTSINPNGGNVGIGTTSPNSLLHIFGSTPTLRLQHNSGTSSVNSGTIELMQSNQTGCRISYDGATDNLEFETLGAGATSGGIFTISNNPGSYGFVGINTTSPSTPLHVNGAITHGGGYAVFGLSVAAYVNGTSVLQFGSTQFSSRITNNTSSFTFQDAGIFMIHVKLNSDTVVTSNIQLMCQYFDGTNWINYQMSEESKAYTGTIDFNTHFMVQATTNQQWRISFNNQSGANWSFSTDAANGTYWSRLMIYKVA